MKNVLVFAPHPDDEVLGCGGTIAFLIKKKYRVNLCLVTESYKPDWTEAFIKNRVEEIRKANRALGIKKVFSLCLPAVKLDTVSQKELNDKLLAIVKKVKPEIILMPHCGDLNIDHRLVAEAALVASRPSKNKSRAVLAYETLSETEWGLRNPVSFSGFAVDVNGEEPVLYKFDNLPIPCILPAFTTSKVAISSFFSPILPCSCNLIN